MLPAPSQRVRARSTDLGLRTAGLGLLGLSWFAIRLLVDLREQLAHGSPSALAVGLAAAGFIAGSLGGALLTLGSQVFEDIEISARWAPPAAQPPLRVETANDDPADIRDPARGQPPVYRIPTRDAQPPRTSFPAMSQAQR